MNNMESNKHAGLGERIIGDNDIFKNTIGKKLGDLTIDEKVQYLAILHLRDSISKIDEARKLKVLDDDLSIGTIDAIDDLVQRAINNIEEASMLFTKAMYKTNK